MGKDHNLIDMTGKRVGVLVVEVRVGTEGRTARWLCRCECGASVVVRGDNLRRCSHRWCRHIHVGRTREYKSWDAMLRRCTDPKDDGYANYGGRGITVCARWTKEFKMFLADMGSKPSPAYTLERIDNDKGYKPENCRWATRAEQRRNMRSSVYVTFNGKRMLLMDVAEETGISRGILYGRIKNGWSLADALTVPPRRKLARSG